MKMKNKTKNNEKLARNTIRVRNNQNKQDKNGKRSLFKRMFAIFSVVLLLVSMLCVSASADIPKDSVNMEGYFINEFVGGDEYELISGDFTSPVSLFDTGVLVDTNVYFEYGDRFGKVADMYYLFNDDRSEVGLRVEFADGSEVYIADTNGMGEYYLYTERILPDIADRDVLEYIAYDYVGNVGSNSSGFFRVLSSITNWIVNALASVQSVYYLDGSLTFIGALVIVGVSIALCWLIIGVFTRFLQLRG